MRKYITTIIFIPILATLLAFLSCESLEKLNENKIYTEILWTLKIKKNIFSSPALDNEGNIYFGTYGKGVYSVTPEGEVRWQYTTDEHSSFTSSPTIANGVLYIGSAKGDLLALSLEDGSLLWKFITSGEVASTVAVGQDGTIYFGSMDNKIYAVNPEGKMLWFFNTEDVVTASPVIDSKGVIYIGSRDSNMYAINPDGTQKWKFGTKDAIYANAMINNDETVIYFVSRNGVLYALDIETAQILWYNEGDNIIFSSVIKGEDDTLYTIDQIGMLKAVSPVDGALLWEYQATGGAIATPAIGEDGTLYVLTTRPDSDEGYFIIVSKEGQLVWQRSFTRDLRSSPVIGKDGTVYFGSKIGRFYALRGKDKGPAKHNGSSFGGNAKHNGHVTPEIYTNVIDTSIEQDATVSE